MRRSAGAKLPRGYLLEDHRCASLGIRGGLSLNALKWYLALVTFRDNDSREVRLSYDKIEHYTGIPRPHIRRAIDALLNHEWVSMASHVPATGERPINVYLLRGDLRVDPRRTISVLDHDTRAPAVIAA